MEKRLQNKGFTMIEMLMVLIIVGVLVLLSAVVIRNKFKKNIYLVINDIAFLQFEAIQENVKTYYEDYDAYITFNRKGGINQANTYHIEGFDVIVSLGTGRIYIHDEEKWEYPD